MGHYSSNSVAETRRPRSSVGGSYAALHGGGHHGHSMSISGIDDRLLAFTTPTPRRSTMRHDAPQLSSIPTPSTLLKRQSAGSLSTNAGFAQTSGARRTHSGNETKERERDVGLPGRRRLSEVGETY
ncbi:MAG: NADH:ubiquinone oxidoreductase [Peltula sp. TS41687]|nr:MAG: NADH:ubiquinone oxidoreductase [Peltula sp. TS41687]